MNPIRQPIGQAVPAFSRSRPSTAAVLVGVVLGMLGSGIPVRAEGNPIVDFKADAALIWNAVTLEAVHDTQPGPTITARALAVVDTCMFDAWAPYDVAAVPTRPSVTARHPVQERSNANKQKAVSFAAYTCLNDLFPSRRAYFGSVLARLGYAPDGMLNDVVAMEGAAAGRAVAEYRHRDGSNQMGDLRPGAYADYTDYVPANQADRLSDVDRWQPLALPNGRGDFQVQQFLTPQWARVLPFALRSGDQFRPEKGPATQAESLLTGTHEFTDQVKEILAYNRGLTDAQKMMAEYWMDGPMTVYPPGHWALFAQAVSERDGHGLDEDVKMLFILGNAMLDASIAVWDSKRHFDSVRPVSVIRHLYQSGLVDCWIGGAIGRAEVSGKDWLPYQPLLNPTPPFPDFVSGHSAFSAAAAEVLKRFTSSDVMGFDVTFKAGSSLLEPGTTPKADVTLSWATFTDAADEASLSRRYGGIHFKRADLEGRAMGRKVADEVWKKAMRYIAGDGPQVAQASP